MVKNFRVIHDNNLPTHSTLQVVLDLGEFTTVKRELRMPLSLHELLKGTILTPEDDGEFKTKEQKEAWKLVIAQFRFLMSSWQMTQMYSRSYLRKRTLPNSSDYGASTWKMREYQLPKCRKT